MSAADNENAYTDNERYYDEVIAPALLQMAKDMEDRGMGFVATVEYNPAEAGTTVNTPALKSDHGKMTYYAARSQANIDGLAIAWAKDVRENKRPHGSIVLKYMGVEPEVERR